MIKKAKVMNTPAMQTQPYIAYTLYKEYKIIIKERESVQLAWNRKHTASSDDTTGCIYQTC